MRKQLEADRNCVALPPRRLGTLPAGDYATTAGQCPGGAWVVNHISEDRANWMILILPYLEHGGLYKSYNLIKPNEDPANRPVAMSRVAEYICPSDVATDQSIVPAMGPAASWALNLPYMPGSYRAMSCRSDGHQLSRRRGNHQLSVAMAGSDARRGHSRLSP